MAFLSEIKHPNIIKLRGYCAQQDARMLVYEYMPNGSLNSQLHSIPPSFVHFVLVIKYICSAAYVHLLSAHILGTAGSSSRGCSLSWHMRIKIAADTAR